MWGRAVPYVPQRHHPRTNKNLNAITRERPPPYPCPAPHIPSNSSPPPYPQPTPSTTCPTCGIPLADAPRGCAGDGRIAGGVGAVLSFWPIKAYRPCPKAEAAGKAYTRKGQITDEMLFGGKGKK